MRYTFRDGDRLREAEVAPLPGGRYRVVVDGMPIELRVERRGEAIELTQLGETESTVRAWVTRDGKFRFVSAPGLADVRLERVEGRQRSRDVEHPPEIASPMPGRVVKVLVAPGDSVKKGQTLVVVEAMKTELALVAPGDGKVTRVHARDGEPCAAGRLLVELARPAAAIEKP